jgi:putative Holliday junction resolvase
MKYLGVDWGEKRIGLASSEEGLALALPYKTVENFKELLEVIKTEEINIVVLGNPRSLSGEDTTNKLYKDFLERLKAALIILPHKPRLVLADERLSSRVADVRRGRRADKGSRDQLAAAIILQDYLERLDY